MAHWSSTIASGMSAVDVRGHLLHQARPRTARSASFWRSSVIFALQMLSLSSLSVSNSDTSLANSSSKLGKLPCSLTSLDLDVEDDRLAGQVLVIILGEGDVEILLLAGLHADDLILKAGDEAAGAQLQARSSRPCRPRTATPLSKPSKSMTAVSPFLASRSTDTRRALRSAMLIEALLDIVGADLDLFLLSRQALVLAQSLTSGYTGNGSLEGEAVLGDLRPPSRRRDSHNDLQASPAQQRPAIGLGECDIDGFLEKHLCAVHAARSSCGGPCRDGSREH